MKPTTATVKPDTRAARRASQSNRAGKSERISYRIAEWSALTGISRVTIWRCIRHGTLKMVRMPGTNIPLIPASEVKRLGLDKTA